MGSMGDWVSELPTPPAHAAVPWLSLTTRNHHGLSTAQPSAWDCGLPVAESPSLPSWLAKSPAQLVEGGLRWREGGSGEPF